MRKLANAALFLMLTLMLTLTTFAQSTNIGKVFQSNFKKAEEMYNHLAYRNAVELYLAVVKKDSLNLVARQRVADCYYRLGNFPEAERWYSSLVNRTDVPPQYMYQYAQVLTSRGKYDQAQSWFQEYAKVTEDNRAQSKIGFIRHLDYYFRDSSLYEVRNEAYNSDQSDFAPQYFNDGVVFVSARDRDMFVKHQSTSALNDKETMLNIYFAPKTAAEERDAVFFSGRDMKSPFHDGPIAFFDNNRRAAFSRSNLVDGRPVTHSGRVNLKLYFGKINGANGLERIEPFPFNDDAYSIAHPWVSDDGNTLFFASNKPGGIGGVDIYISEKKNNEWQTPVNPGPAVNTMGDEFYPFLANDSTLYFSSTGHGGFGGLDIYISRKRQGSWSPPENPGFPLNSATDDFALVTDAGGRHGMFSSDRTGGLGYDDVYSFTAKTFSIVGRTVNKLDPSRPEPAAKIIVADEGGQWAANAISNNEGYFYLDVPFDKSLRFSAEKPGYTCLDTVRFSTHTRTMGRDSIELKLWNHSLFAKGMVYSNESQQKLPDATVVIKNLTDGALDSVQTTDGSYSFELRPDKKYLITGSRDGFIPSKFELNTTGIMTGSLLNDMVLEEEFREKFVLQFEFEKWDIKPESHASLDEVARAMSRNKKYHLHVSAYADSQGTHEFNLDLSNKRAKEVVKYLEGRGLNSNRITAIGFGEELLLNRCSNGVVCHDDEHAKNRRAELKVQ